MPEISRSAQDYLKAIYKLAAETDRVSTSALARRQRVTAASASAMVKKLAALELAEHTPYRGVTLTHAGEQVAIEVIRHHRLLELYLAQTLGIGIEDVHAEADRLEHVLSEELEARIDEQLGFPTHDPHGDPIPDAGLRLEMRELRSLDALEPGEELDALAVEREREQVLPHGGPMRQLIGQVALKRANDERAGSVVPPVGGHHRPPAGGVAQPVEHLAARHEVGEANEHFLDRLGGARAGGNTPVLSPPVEPAPRELLDGLVELVVDREAEHDLPLAGVVGQEEDAPRDGRGGALGRI